MNRLFGASIITATLFAVTSAQASNMSFSCADAYGDYFLEGNQVFGRTSEAYFPVEILQTVLISREREKCTNKAGDTFESFSEQSVVRVKGTPNAEMGEVQISFLCEEFGDTYPNLPDIDTKCVTKETVRQGPFTER